MAKTKKLTARRVETVPEGRYGDGNGLWLTVRGDGARSWSVRYTFRGRRREMGIGPTSARSLADAREIAREVRRQVLDGLDPIEVRRLERSRVVPTFQDCAERFIALNSAAWSNEKHRQQWENTLATYANPVIGRKPVDQIETPDVLRILEPIWTVKPETAVRVRGRIERVLAWAATQNLRPRENPAAWKNHLDAILPPRSKVRAVRHHRALPWDQVPGFVQQLRLHDGIGPMALEFLILTAARSGEVRGASWAEIDLDSRIWTIPAERMKSRRGHRVPLSSQTVELLESLPRFTDEEFLFPSPRRGLLSDMTLSAVLRRMNVDAVPHGFRSSFRDWCAEATRFPREVAEAALAHSLPNKTEAAYLRGDFFEKRRALMNSWSAYCSTPPVAMEGAKVVPIEGAK